jgi:hypothetical protein
MPAASPYESKPNEKHRSDQNTLENEHFAERLNLPHLKHILRAACIVGGATPI